ncbi:hypothetical protein ABZ172_11955 [Streptomyces sp. NPDC006296]|uniref:hypothetical protein n=1 Tax=Streptomyces sp. NPDC006296 TaxID=3156746 RepID=UPI0033B28E7E
MADDMAARLLAKMRGEAPPSPTREPKVDPGTQALWDQMRGDGPSARRLYAEHRESDRQAEKSFEARVRARAQELVSRHEGGHHPLEAARAQLRREVAEKARQDEKRAAYDAMVTSNRAESQKVSTESLRNDIKASTTQRREENMKRLVASLMAQLNASA